MLAAQLLHSGEVSLALFTHGFSNRLVQFLTVVARKSIAPFLSESRQVSDLAPGADARTPGGRCLVGALNRAFGDNLSKARGIPDALGSRHASPMMGSRSAESPEPLGGPAITRVQATQPLAAHKAPGFFEKIRIVCCGVLAQVGSNRRNPAVMHVGPRGVVIATEFA